MKSADIGDPWRAPIIVGQIPETGLTRELEADAATRSAIWAPA